MQISAGGVAIEVDDVGRGEPLLLIMGLGMQMIGWDEELCERLAARGFRVIRFDNRDVGLSTKLDALEDRDPLRVWNEMMRKRARPTPPYTLDDDA